MAIESFTERAQRKRREERRNWTVENEREWLAAHPNEKPLEGYEQAAAAPRAPDPLSHDPDLVPDVEQYQKPAEEEEIDAVIDRIDIIEAYNKWAKKGRVDPKGKTEGIKVRCPNPSHPDHDPSAWLNTKKDVWVCGGCGMEGGDKFDIAAWGLGFAVPGYKDGKKFPELRRAMAVDMGYTVRKRGKSETATKQEEQQPPADEASPPAPTGDDAQASSTVTPLRPDPLKSGGMALTAEEQKLLSIPWKKIVPEGTFLWDWMEATTEDDLPEEYHFWTGIMAVGLAVGNDIKLIDSPPVYANLFCTIIGRTSAGKSRALSHLGRLVNDAFPYDPGDPANYGVKHVRGAGSGEVLIDSFSEIHDDGSGTVFTNPVRGLIEFNELAALVGKSRAGSSSILKPVLMDFYDHPPVITAASRTHGVMKAEDAFGSCITTTQPRAVRELVSNADLDSGFLNRWIFVYGIDKQRVSYNLSPIDIEKAVESAKALKAWAAMRRHNTPMRLEGEALKLWDRFFHEKIIPMYAPDPLDEDDDSNPMFGRLALLFKKLILVFAINSKESQPSIQSVRRALSLWTYIEASYIRVSGHIATSAATELENRIIEMLRSYKDLNRKGANTKVITDNVKRRFSREEVKQTLQRLEALNVIEEVTEKGGTRGRPARYYELVDED